MITGSHWIRWAEDLFQEGLTDQDKRFQINPE
jgi:hypothetical protein